MAAFQALGPFISTFADPLITALLHNQNGEIVITDPAQLAERLAKVVALAAEAAALERSEQADKMDLSGDENSRNGILKASDDQSYEEIRAKSLEDKSEYCSFLYWRDPVDSLLMEDIDLLEDRDIISSKIESQLSSTTSELSNVIHEATIEEVRNELSTLDTESSTEDIEQSGIIEKDDVSDTPDHILEAQLDSIERTDPEPSQLEEANLETKSEVEEVDVLDDDLEPLQSVKLPSDTETGRWTSLCETTSMSSSQETELQDLALPRGPPQTNQSIVPQLLIDHYVSMIDPSRAQTVDNDIARHCAFSFPAVALTLGRANWPLLRDTYEILANDMQWKVRRTLASSIHELGVILGEELSTAHLVPIFNGFIKDLDEVRIGILKHLADFLNLLSPTSRADYLPRLEEFLKMDNERNWRFRLELSEQLSHLVSLVSPEDIRYHLAPIALSLVQDKVSCVRQSAVAVITVMLTSLNTSDQSGLARDIMVDLAENLAHSQHWARRQTFASLCGALVTVIPYQHFSLDLLPHLLDLTWDVVPNVKLKVAHVFGHILPDEHYDDVSSPNFDLIHQSLASLAADRDHDVRQAAALKGRVEACPPPLPPVQNLPETSQETDLDLVDEQDEISNPTWAQIVETAPTSSSREDLESEE